MVFAILFFFKQKPAYELRISDWSSDVCSSELILGEDFLVSGVHLVAVRLERLRDHAPSAEGHDRTLERRIRLKPDDDLVGEIGRAPCRERVCQYVSISVVAGSLTEYKLT